MNKSQAKNLVGRMVQWNFKHMGIIDEEVEPITESLEEMIEANRIVEKLNKNPLKSNHGNRVYYTTIDDRLIAALYVLMHFEGQPVSNMTSIAEYQSKFLVVVKHNQKLNEPNEHDWK